MSKVTVSQFKEALAAREKHAPFPVAGQHAIVRTATRQETLRLGAQSRYEAAKYLSEGPQRNVVFVEEPFLYLATWTPRVFPHTSILGDSAIEPGNTWVKVGVDDDGTDQEIRLENSDGDDYYAGPVVDTLTFYYYWENETAYTAIVDVSAFMTVSGSWTAEASTRLGYGPNDFPNPNDVPPNDDGSHDHEGGDIPDPPQPHTRYPGSAHLGLSANLALYQWWNSPPTLAPLLNVPDQQTQINFLNLNVKGPGSFGANLINWFELKQRFLVIPSGATLVAEVNFDISHLVDAGHVIADFNGDGNQITSHWLQVEYVVGPQALIPTPVSQTF